MNTLRYEDLSYKIIGACYEVHKELGKGFLEVVYKDALEEEFDTLTIPYEREKSYKIFYKGKPLRRVYVADFVVFEKIILEVKAIDNLHSSHIGQTLNYLAAAKLGLGMLVNFGETSLRYRRVVL